jgi:hypothetical protein
MNLTAKDVVGFALRSRRFRLELAEFFVGVPLEGGRPSLPIGHTVSIGDQASFLNPGAAERSRLATRSIARLLSRR